MFNIFKRFERKKDPSVSDSVSEYSASSNLDTKIPRRKPPPLYSRSSPSTSVDSVRGIRSASLPLPSDISENVSNEYPSVLEKKEKSKRRVSYLDLLETSGCHATCDSKNLSPVYSCEALRSIINEYRRKYVGFSDSSPCDDSFYRVNDLHEDELNLTNQQYKFATEICSTYNSSLEADIKIKVNEGS
ncbi:hypothetical protein AB6A40_009796 [Gnathostoma spinigerum]|uniref:Uncharacterized protein n=1 Tax=Gnathostoma spinigerum TaxID=75299 RepID=A0ABD6F1A5_9BILA